MKNKDAELLAELFSEEARRNAELHELRADLREAIRLLGQAWSEGAGDATWSREAFSLLAKHKETNQ